VLEGRIDVDITRSAPQTSSSPRGSRAASVRIAQTGSPLPPASTAPCQKLGGNRMKPPPRNSANTATPLQSSALSFGAASSSQVIAPFGPFFTQSMQALHPEPISSRLSCQEMAPNGQSAASACAAA
jgi:hypothetical protein